MPGDAACRSSRRTVALPGRQRRRVAPRRQRVAAVRRGGAAARRDLPVHRPHRGQASRGAAAAQGKPGNRRRADRRHRARVPQRAGDDPWLQQAARSEGPAGELPALRRRDPRRDGLARRGRDQLPQLRAAGAADAVARRSADDLRAGGRRDPRRRARASAATSPCAASSASSRATRCCCARRSATCCATRVEACAGASIAPVVVDPVGGRSGRSKLSRITVNDNGPGIEPAARERVFRPFFTSKRNGTGLGLALVQKIIVFHNGRVSASTSPLGGASLQVSLPVN